MAHELDSLTRKYGHRAAPNKAAATAHKVKIRSLADQPSDQLSNALDLIDHYHTHHTSDLVTRFTGGEHPDIYITNDPEWKRRFRDLTAGIFPTR